MKEEKDIQELIERYLDGFLEGSELDQVETRMQSDQLFRQEVRAQQLLRDLVIENRLRSTSALLNDIKGTQGGNSRVLKNSLYGVAALFILGSCWYFLQPEPTSLVVDMPENKEQQLLPAKPLENKQAPGVKAPSALTETASDPIVKKAGTLPAEKDTDAQVNIEKTEKDSSEVLEAVAPKVVQTPSVEHIEEDTQMKKEKPEDPCLLTSITSKITVKPACDGRPEGQVMLSGIAGGKAPYTLHAEKGKISGASLKNLWPGEYSVHLTDANNCSGPIMLVTVPDSVCTKIKDFSFNPFTGQTWRLQVQNNKSGILKVLKQSGEVYFTTNFATGEMPEWDGRSGSGELNSGLYLYILQYSDGAIEQGTVTIVM